jgi:hypothetical protein
MPTYALKPFVQGEPGPKGHVRKFGKEADGYKPQFLFGWDAAEGNIRAIKVQKLWQRVEATDGHWQPETLLIAKAIAKGQASVSIEPNPAMDGSTMDNPERERAESYMHWVGRFAEAYGDLIRIVPSDPDLYERAEGEVEAIRHETIRRLNIEYPKPNHATASLHEALDAFAKSEIDANTAWGQVQLGQVARLKDRHADMPLAGLGLDEMEEMIKFWAKRPKAKSGKVCAYDTCKKQIEQLRRFFKWLPRAKYGWRKPELFGDKKFQVVSLPEDNKKRQRAEQIRLHTKDELKTLLQYASPIMRAYILLGLNCDFSIAEFASLDREEVQGDYIKRIRRKTGVYGEWKLWPETKEAMAEGIKRADAVGEKNLVFVTNNGIPYDARTKGGKKSSKLASLWNNLHETIKKEEDPNFRHLPPKQLRKTAHGLMRELVDGEIAGLFACRGTPVKSDQLAEVYSNPIWKKVHQACDDLRKELRHVLEVLKKG